MANNKKKEEIREENAAATRSATENFFVQNRKVLIIALVAVVVVGLGIMGYSKWIYAPSVAEAQENSYVAELNFQSGEFELALNGDGVNLGFAQICDEYGAKAGKAVYLYAGTCCAQLGQWEDALSYLKKYKGTEPILAARALALQGDCYSALSDNDSAAKYYMKAAQKADNAFAAEYLVKAGQAYEALGQKDKALEAYKTVKDKYQMSLEYSLIDKYINEVSE
jgi:tetratricopeptide (TPR) repeat protein